MQTDREISRILLRARVIAPVESEPIDDGLLTVRGERIEAISKYAGEADAIDLGDVVVLPGFVNSHAHLEFSDVERPLGRANMPLPDWLQMTIAARGACSGDRSSAIQAGLAESLRYGVTFVADVAQADFIADDRELDGIAFREIIAPTRGRFDTAVELAQTICETAKQQTGRWPWGISPHAPYTVPLPLLERITPLAVANRTPIMTHLAESPDEIQLLSEGAGPFRDFLESMNAFDAELQPAGRTPMDYLSALAKAERTLVVHGNYLNDAEIDFLASRRDRMSVVFCPRTHRYFGHAPYPLQKMLDAGVRVVLGTDGRGSAPDLDVLAEARFIAQHFPDVERRKILRMITLDAAEALGQAATIGNLTPGKLANFVLVPFQKEHGGDWLSAVLESDSCVRETWLRGQKYLA